MSEDVPGATSADSSSVAKAHAFVQRLVDLGLEHAVLSPGSRNAPISITLAQAAQQGLITLHVRIDEREAAFLALGLSKQSDVPALLCCTSGTAAVNFAPAVVEAFYSQVPLVVLTADRPEGAVARGASQSIEQNSLFAPHAVANLAVHIDADAQAAADRARIAWNASRGARRGPAHVNMHLAEPLLVPESDWPSVERATPFSVAPPADVPPSLRELPAFGATPVMLVGDAPSHQQHHVAAAAEIAAGIGMPVLMEPTAGVRDVRVAIRHHALVADAFAAQATSVISVGRFGLGRHLRRLCEQAPLHVAFEAYGTGADPYATADVRVPLSGIAAALSSQAKADPHWLPAWRDADAAAHSRIDGILSSWAQQPTGLHIAREVLGAASSNGSIVFAAASRSIRDVDLMADHDGPCVLGNLGVNGIDGLISSAAGVALASGNHTYLIAGDLAFLHGSNGLVIPSDESQPSLTIVVNDDNGGAIFSDLEQGAADYAPWFERVFGTPHDLDLVALARGYGVSAVEAFDLEQLRKELAPQPGIKVIVVVSADREQSKQLRASLRN